MSQLVQVRMPSNYKAKVAARDRDLMELGKQVSTTKTRNIQYEEAFEELESLGDLCQSTAESLFNTMDLSGMIKPPPNRGDEPIEKKNSLRFRIYNLVSAAALLEAEYRKALGGQSGVDAVMHSSLGTMTASEKAQHAPRNLVSHISKIQAHLDESDDEDYVDSTENPDHQAYGQASESLEVGFTNSAAFHNLMK